MPQAKKSKALVATKPLKYEPVPVLPVPCTLEELETHLRGFIASFVPAEAQERWLNYLIDKRPLWFAEDKAPRNIRVLHKVDSLLNHFPGDSASLRPLEGAEGFPASLAVLFGDRRGVYFDMGTAPCTLTAAEAATNATEQYQDALLLFDGGRLALFFSHEGGCWLCKR